MRPALRLTPLLLPLPLLLLGACRRHSWQIVAEPVVASPEAAQAPLDPRVEAVPIGQTADPRDAHVREAAGTGAGRDGAPSGTD